MVTYVKICVYSSGELNAHDIGQAIARVASAVVLIRRGVSFTWHKDLGGFTSIGHHQCKTLCSSNVRMFRLHVI